MGAGDSFTSGLLAALVRRGWHTPSSLAACTAPQLLSVLDDAITVSAITCERAGANPPTLADLAPTGWGTGNAGPARRPGEAARREPGPGLR